MNTPQNGTTRSSYHPMMIIAALAVVLFCLAGTAAIMGWIPSSIGGNSPNGELSDADKQALASQLQAEAKTADEPVQRATPAPAKPRAPTQVAAAAPARDWCANCGNVESIREITTRAQGSGLGAAGGAVLGGLLGNQIGGGHGKQLATVAGAVGGAVVGNQVEGNMKATKSYQITVRLDDGSARTFTQHNPPGWRTGERVKIVKGALRSVG